MIIRNKIILFVFVTWLALDAYSQEKDIVEIEILARHTNSFDNKSRLPLLNSNGSIVGTYTTYMDGKEYMYKISLPNGSNISINALSNLLICEDADRIITYGNSLIDHTAGMYLDFKIYSLSGDLIKSMENVTYYGSILQATSDGSFVVIGRKNLNNPELRLLKFNSDGSKAWENSIEGGDPINLKISGDGKNLTVSVSRLLGSSSTYFYQLDGTLISELKGHVYSSAEFIDNDKVVILLGKRWLLFDFAKEKTLSYGDMDSYVFSKYPISYNPFNQTFAIVTTSSDEPDSEILIQFFSAVNGNLLAKTKFQGTAHLQEYRSLDFLSADRCKVFLDKDYVELKLTN